MSQYTIGQSSLAHLLFSDKRSAWLWLVIRLYLGYEWLMAGWEKMQSPAWVGDQAGAGLSGFLGGALKMPPTQFVAAHTSATLQAIVH